MKAKKLRLAKLAMWIQEFQLDETIHRNEILLSTNGPGGSNYAKDLHFFEMKHKEMLAAMTRRAKESFGMSADMSGSDEVCEQERET